MIKNYKTQTHGGDYRKAPLTINDNTLEDMGSGEGERKLMSLIKDIPKSILGERDGEGVPKWWMTSNCEWSLTVNRNIKNTLCIVILFIYSGS